MKSIRTLAPLLLALAAAAPLSAQMLEGTVLDQANNQPVAEAHVEALRPNGRVAARARTDTAGHFLLQLREAGDYRIRTSRVGYRTATSLPLRVELRQTVAANVQISTSEVVLDPLTVTARSVPPRAPRLDREGFYEREQRGSGHFLTRYEIDQANATESSEIFRTVPGIRLLPAGGAHYRIALSRGGDDCQPRLVVDNLPIATDELDSFVRPEQIAGIEVYRGPSETPARWRGMPGVACGLIVVWTQAGAR